MKNFRIESYKHFTKVMSSFTEELQVVFIEHNKDWLEMQVFACGGGVFSSRRLKKIQYQIIESELRSMFSNDLIKVSDSLSHSGMRHCLDNLDKESSESEIRQYVRSFFKLD